MENSSKTIVTTSNNGISRVKLNDPKTYNALTLETIK